MRKIVKIVLFALLFLLAVFSLIAEMPIAKTLERYLDFALYVRLASLLGLLIALVWFWSKKQQTASSQKFQRANEVLAEAETTARRRHQAVEKLEQKLKQEFAEKDQGLDAHIHQIKSNFEQRIKTLNEQNMQLKETVSKLMAALKKERQKNQKAGVRRTN